MSKRFYFEMFSLIKARSLNIKTVLFHVIQFNISTQFSSISLIDITLSDATSPGQSGPGSDDNEGVFCIPQSSRIILTSLSDYLATYQDTRLGAFPLCRDTVGVFYSPS